MQLQLVILVILVKLSVQNILSCPNSYATNGETKPLYVLTLVSRRGFAVLPGQRVARNEINNRTGLLSGHHIELIVEDAEDCSSTESVIGLSSLLKHSLNPLCRPVIAVAGLGCSSLTSALSPIAGHEGFDLIQLSSANSPIFETQSKQFPHLWRFLGSSTVYTDAVLAIMEQFNWTRVGIVYNTESLFHSRLAKNLKQKISSTAKNVTFFLGIRQTIELYLNTAISNINETDTTILVSLLVVKQTEELLKKILENGLVYPKYIWIHIEKVQRYFQNNSSIYNATRGHIYLYTRGHVDQEQVLVSGETFDTYNKAYHKDLELVKRTYNNSELKPISFAKYWYDQIWGLALAVNNSLPILKNRNLSIDNYTIGQNGITAVIEEQMSKLSFQGAGGWVDFNQYRGVSTPVEIYWILEDGNQTCVGIYNPLDAANFHVSINASNLPNDTLYRTYEFILIPHLVTILLYILTGAVIIFTTVQLTLYLYYREHKVIKATSPYLSLLMFGGCYLFCLSASLSIAQNSFVISSITYTVLFYIIFVLGVDAASLILITFFLKLLRVERIFTSKLKTDLGKYWSNIPLLLSIVSLTLINNIITIPILIFDTPGHTNYTDNKELTVEIHIRPVVKLSWIMVAYAIIFLVAMSYLAIRTRKIRHSNFKDTKKINVLITLLIIVIVFTAVVCAVLYGTGKEPLGNIVLILGILSIPMLCQLILFTPKIIPVLFKKSTVPSKSLSLLLITKISSISLFSTTSS